MSVFSVTKKFEDQRTVEITIFGALPKDVDIVIDFDDLNSIGKSIIKEILNDNPPPTMTTERIAEKIAKEAYPKIKDVCSTTRGITVRVFGFHNKNNSVTYTEAF